MKITLEHINPRQHKEKLSYSLISLILSSEDKITYKIFQKWVGKFPHLLSNEVFSLLSIQNKFTEKAINLKSQKKEKSYNLNNEGRKLLSLVLTLIRERKDFEKFLEVKSQKLTFRINENFQNKRSIPFRLLYVLAPLYFKQWLISYCRTRYYNDWRSDLWSYFSVIAVDHIYKISCCDRLKSGTDN